MEGPSPDEGYSIQSRLGGVPWGTSPVCHMGVPPSVRWGYPPLGRIGVSPISKDRGTPHREGGCNPPPRDGVQSENITLCHPSDAGGNEGAMSFPTVH